MKQGGYAMLLSVFVLLGLGGVWFASTARHTVGHPHEQAMVLGKAKEALIHYAVSYIDLYGAQGAGLGHLPCPDTDKPSAQSSDPWHLDGPNPPCAKEFVQFGWLPRHVNIESGRYQFHALTQQRLLYAVSSGYINNPISRIVNPDTHSDFQVGQFDDVIAILALPTIEADASTLPSWFLNQELDTPRMAYTIIRNTDIQPQIVQRAGVWLRERMNAALGVRCDASNNLTTCDEFFTASTRCVLSEELAVLHWMSLVSSSADCDAYESNLRTEFELLESVPLGRHWFIRNKWYRFVDFELAQDCLVGGMQKCTFAFSVGNEGRLRFVAKFH